jgi:hypothetical protein
MPPCSDEGTCSGDEHRCEGQRQWLGNEHRTEVQLFAYEKGGSPIGTQGEDVGGSLVRDSPTKAPPDSAYVALFIEREEWKPCRSEAGIGARRKGSEPQRLDNRDHPRPTRKGDGMARSLCGAGNGNEWFQVAAATCEGKEHAHGDDLLLLPKTAAQPAPEASAAGGDLLVCRTPRRADRAPL